MHFRFEVIGEGCKFGGTDQVENPSRHSLRGATVADTLLKVKIENFRKTENRKPNIEIL
jgi:hypothetical protein